MNYRNMNQVNTAKKLSIIAITGLMLLTSVSAINIESIDFGGENITADTSETVKAVIDGDGIKIDNVTVSVLENGTQTVRDAEMLYRQGDISGISDWITRDTVQTNKEAVSYRVDVLAYDMEGNKASDYVIYDADGDNYIKTVDVDSQGFLKGVIPESILRLMTLIGIFTALGYIILVEGR